MCVKHRETSAVIVCVISALVLLLSVAVIIEIIVFNTGTSLFT